MEDISGSRHGILMDLVVLALQLYTAALYIMVDTKSKDAVASVSGNSSSYTQRAYLSLFTADNVASANEVLPLRGCSWA